MDVRHALLTAGAAVAFALVTSPGAAVASPRPLAQVVVGPGTTAPPATEPPVTQPPATAPPGTSAPPPAAPPTTVRKRTTATTRRGGTTTTSTTRPLPTTTLFTIPGQSGPAGPASTTTLATIPQNDELPSWSTNLFWIGVAGALAVLATTFVMSGRRS